MVRERRIIRTLVLCPKAVMAHWGLQIERWLPGRRSLVLSSGPVRERAARLDGFEDGIAVLNYDAVAVPAMLAAVRRWAPAMLILDEVHRLSAPGGKRSRAVAGIAAPWRLGLSGTVLQHSPLNAYGVYRALDSRLFGTSYTQFRAQFTEPCRWPEKDGVEMGRGGLLQPYRFVHLDQLHEKMLSIGYQVNTRDVLDMPPESDSVLSVELEPEARRVYRALDHDLTVDIREGRVTAANVLVRLLRLQQITSGSVTIDTEVRNDNGEMSGLRENNRADRAETMSVMLSGREEKESISSGAVLSQMPENDSERQWQSGATLPRLLEEGNDTPSAIVQGGGLYSASRLSGDNEWKAAAGTGGRIGSVQSSLYPDAEERDSGASGGLPGESSTGVGLDDLRRLPDGLQHGGGSGSGASLGHGAISGATTQELRDASPQERNSKRQPDGELGAVGQAAGAGEKGGGLTGLGGGAVSSGDGLEAGIRRGTSRTVIVSTAKESALTEYLTDLGAGEPVVVFCRFRADLAAAHRAAAAAGLGSLELSGSRNELAEWQAGGDATVLVAQVAAGSLGVELHRAAYAVFLSLGYSLSEYLQARGRLIRPDQTRPVLFTSLIAKGTIDEEIMKALDRREEVIESVLRTRRTE